ncbi:MAG: hypothetical protein Q7V01_16380 [Vicinamibacterales bacterium]|nr:hypothetical protein [Vicinamibacterales bacterium]
MPEFGAQPQLVDLPVERRRLQARLHGCAVRTRDTPAGPRHECPEVTPLGVFEGPDQLALIAAAAKRSLEATGLSDVGGHRQQALSRQVVWHFNTGASFQPWVGLSGGYEWTRFTGAKLPSGKETEIGRPGIAGAISIGGDCEGPLPCGSVTAPCAPCQSSFSPEPP